MPWVHVYWWLEANNLYKAAVAFGVTLLLSAVLTAAMRPWRAWQEHKRTQEKIADRLDTETPGGLADLVKALDELRKDLSDGETPDDNGSDPESTALSIRKRPHGSRMTHDIRDIRVIPEPGHGGSSAGHH